MRKSGTNLKSMKKKLLIVVGVVLGLFILITIIGATSPEGKKSFESGMQKGKESVEGSEESKIQTALKSVLDEKEIKEISVTPVDPQYALDGGKFNVTVAFYVDEAGSEKASAIKLKSTEVFASLFKDDLGVNEAWTFAWYPTNNPEMVLKAKMDRVIADKAEKTSKATFQYDAANLMVVEKSSF